MAEPNDAGVGPRQPNNVDAHAGGVRLAGHPTQAVDAALDANRSADRAHRAEERFAPSRVARSRDEPAQARTHEPADVRGSVAGPVIRLLPLQPSRGTAKPEVAPSTHSRAEVFEARARSLRETKGGAGEGPAPWDMARERSRLRAGLGLEEAGLQDPPTVVVRIGRIDVSAVHTSTPTATVAKPSSGLQKPSLNDYLRARDRRGT
jgi:hypothetical protein